MYERINSKLPKEVQNNMNWKEIILIIICIAFIIFVIGAVIFSFLLVIKSDIPVWLKILILK